MMEIEEFTAKRASDLLDEWKCFICKQEKPGLTVFADWGNRIDLICDSCREEEARKILMGDFHF